MLKLKEYLLEQSGKGSLTIFDIDDKRYGSLVEASADYPHIPYSSLRTAARIGYSKKYNLRITHV